MESSWCHAKLHCKLVLCTVSVPGIFIYKLVCSSVSGKRSQKSSQTSKRTFLDTVSVTFSLKCLFSGDDNRLIHTLCTCLCLFLFCMIPTSLLFCIKEISSWPHLPEEVCSEDFAQCCWNYKWMVLHSNVCRPPQYRLHTWIRLGWMQCSYQAGYFYLFIFKVLHVLCNGKGKKWDNVHATFWCISLYCNSVFKKIIINLFIMYHLRVVSCCDFAVNVM